jgi:hypothetical protein
MTTKEFFESVYNGELFETDIKDYVKSKTENYDPDLFLSFCRDFDIFLAVKRKELEDLISVNQLMDLDKKDIIYLTEFEVKTFFIKGFMENSNQLSIWFKNDKLYNLDFIDSDRVLNIDKMFFPAKLALLEFLKDYLLHIWFEVIHTQNTIQSINWLKGSDSLRQFLDSIKKAGLIENRDTDEIIQEHFRQTDQTLQPIQWSKSNRLLIYLFNKLTEADLVDTMDRQFQLISEHFLNKKGQPLKADNLKSDSYNMKNFYTSDPKGSETIDRIIQELTD